MENCFSLHSIMDDLMKLHLGALYLNPECWKWWKLHKNSNEGYIGWERFSSNLYEQFETNTHYFLQLTKLKKSNTFEDFILYFEQLVIHTEGMSSVTPLFPPTYN